jgi:hypothetical protein
MPIMPKGILWGAPACCCVAPHLYEIPISSIAHPSRKHMGQLASHRAPERDRTARERTAFACSIHLKLVSAKGGDTSKEASMLDIIMLAIGLGFFALSVGYTLVCDRL